MWRSGKTCGVGELFQNPDDSQNVVTFGFVQNFGLFSKVGFEASFATQSKANLQYSSGPSALASQFVT